MKFEELGYIQKLEVPDELWDKIIYLAWFFLTKKNISANKYSVIIFSVVTPIFTLKWYLFTTLLEDICVMDKS